MSYDRGVTMRTLIVAVCAFVLVGCTTVNYDPPVNVTAMPNDCANRTAIINWLTELESKQPNERYRKDIRAKIWTMRYNCQPV